MAEGYTYDPNKQSKDSEEKPDFRAPGGGGILSRYWNRTHGGEHTESGEGAKGSRFNLLNLLKDDDEEEEDTEVSPALTARVSRFKQFFGRFFPMSPQSEPAAGHEKARGHSVGDTFRTSEPVAESAQPHHDASEISTEEVPVAEGGERSADSDAATAAAVASEIPSEPEATGSEATPEPAVVGEGGRPTDAESADTLTPRAEAPAAEAVEAAEVTDGEVDHAPESLPGYATVPPEVLYRGDVTPDTIPVERPRAPETIYIRDRSNIGLGLLEAAVIERSIHKVKKQNRKLERQVKENNKLLHEAARRREAPVVLLKEQRREPQIIREKLIEKQQKVHTHEAELTHSRSEVKQVIEQKNVISNIGSKPEQLMPRTMMTERLTRPAVVPEQQPQQVEADEPKELKYELSHENKDMDGQAAAQWAALQANAAQIAQANAAAIASAASAATRAAMRAEDAANEASKANPNLYRKAAVAGAATAIVIIAAVIVAILVQSR